MASVSLRDVVKRYGEHAAVRDLTLEVPDGELLVLVGPSGCGKTTSLRMIAGLEDPDDGRIQIGDRDVTSLPPDERDVAMVFQSYALFPHMTVFENLAFGLRARKRPDAEVRAMVAEAAATLGLDALLERKPRQLSGGERQRVALGRAIVRHPAVFLMDEPLSNLDARLRVQTRAEIQRLQARLGATMIYVTHDQTEALGLGHRVGVMDAGLLQQAGTPREIYDRPANAFVASFIGSPPMNLLPVRQVGRDLVWDGGVAGAPDAPRVPGERATLGVRPEHVHVAGSAWAPADTTEPAGPDDRMIDAVVDVVEAVGDQTILFLNAGSAILAARVEPSFPARSGDALRIRLDPRHLHLFDPDSGDALWHA